MLGSQCSTVVLSDCLLTMLHEIQHTRKRTKKKASSSLFPRKFIERAAFVSLILLGWGWVFILIGIVLFKGHVHPTNSNSAHALSVQHVVRKSHAHSDVSPSSALDSKDLIEMDPLRIIQSKYSVAPYESPLLIFTCNREAYLEETLSKILNFIPDDCSIGCPVIISQDGSNPKVSNVIAKYTASFQEQKHIPVVHLNHPSSLRRGGINSYQALAVHYGWALKHVFDRSSSSTIRDKVGLDHWRPAQRIIILEEDIRVAPDFFDYFRALAPILDKDSTLLAVSAFNDNGFGDQVKETTRVLRSDFFPGLGWMMNRKLWDAELAAKWPAGYWDDWLREPVQRRDRHVLRPEVSRTFHFGTRGGASSNQFGNRLSSIKLNTEAVDWNARHEQLATTLEEHTYNTAYLQQIEAATPAVSLKSSLNACATSNVRLEYTSWRQFQSFARQLSLMDDEKATIPRTGYKGVVETRPTGNNILFLIPPMEKLRRSLSSSQGE